jgi:hypothetical protein
MQAMLTAAAARHSRRIAPGVKLSTAICVSLIRIQFQKREGIVMHRGTLKLSSALCAFMLSTAAVFAQSPAYTQAGPIPPALLAAKTVFVSNGGSDSQLFPDIFSGDANRPYSQFYASLKATGKYDLAADPSQADLVLNLRVVAARCVTWNGKCMGQSDAEPSFRLTIFESKTHYVLWTVTEPIEYALLQKNKEHNFDTALDAVVSDFEKVTGKFAAKP